MKTTIDGLEKIKLEWKKEQFKIKSADEDIHIRVQKLLIHYYCNDLK